jgi:hypothetical protein
MSEIFQTFLMVLRPVAIAMMLISGLLLVFFRNIPEKDEKIEIDLDTDEGKILQENEYSKKFFSVINRIFSKIKKINIKNIYSSEDSDEVIYKGKKVILQELVKEHFKKKGNWLLMLSEEDDDNFFEHFLPVAVAFYSENDSFVGTFPAISEEINLKDVYKNDLSKALKDAYLVSIGFLEAFRVPKTEKEEEENPEEDTENSADLPFL